MAEPKNWRDRIRMAEIRTKLVVGFLILLFLFIVNAVFDIYSQRQIKTSIDEINQSLNYLQMIQEFRDLINQQRIQMYAHLGNEDDIEMELLQTKIFSNSETLRNVLTQIRAASPSSQSENTITGIEKTLETYLAELEKTLTLSQNYSKKEGYNKANRQDIQYYERLQEHIEQLIALSNKLVATDRKLASEKQQQQLWGILFFGSLTFFVIIVLTLVTNGVIHRTRALAHVTQILAKGNLTQGIATEINDELGRLGHDINTMRENLRNLVDEMGNTAIQLNASTNEILLLSQKQVGDSANQNSAISEFSASLNEMAATSNELGRNMDNIVDIVHQTIQVANEGTGAIESSLESMEHIRDANDMTAEKFNTLVEKVERISKVLNTITSIADKTNLLSVNASIEAVKAGEFGKGFGVVATEIRRLADQTMLASQEISDMLDDIQKAANASMMSMDKSKAITREGTERVHLAGTSIHDLIEAVQDIGPRVEEMKEATDQQTEGTRQMTQAIRQIQEASANHKINAEQNAHIADKLSEMAKDQLEVVKVFVSSKPLAQTETPNDAFMGTDELDD